LTELYEHQRVGVARIVEDPYLWNGDEMGNGKTRQGIEGAQVMWERGEIDRTLVLAPSQVYREVWADRILGQLREYMRVPSTVHEFRPGRKRGWRTEGSRGQRNLEWVVSNYEFIRSAGRLRELLPLVDKRTFLILDESIAVQSPKSATTLAVWALRQQAKKVLLLNGTEGGGDTPASLYAQAKMMSPAILGCKGFYEFQARYAVMGGFRRPQKRKVLVDGRWQWKTVRVPCEVERWINLDDLWGRLAPHYLRRLKSQCLDLPPKIPPVAVGVTMSKVSWAAYQAMKKDAVAFFGGGMVTAKQAGVNGLRLAQLTSGFLGGIQDVNDDGLPYGDPRLEEVGREKLDALLAWYGDRLAEEPAAKLIVWTRFRAEAERTIRALAAAFPHVEAAPLVGGQKREARQRAVAMLDPKTARPGPAVVVGTESAGAYGLNQAAAHLVVHLSGGFSHVIRTQTDERPDRPGQTSPISYFDFVATGPEGQRTVDHHIVAALRKKLDIARWSAAEWREALREDEDEGEDS